MAAPNDNPIANGYHESPDATTSANASPSNKIQTKPAPVDTNPDSMTSPNINPNTDSNPNTNTTTLSSKSPHSHSLSNHDHKSPEDPDDGKEENKSAEHKSASLLSCGILERHEIEQFSMKEAEIQRDCIPLSWSNCDARSFEVRRGPNYVSGQKAPSKSALYTIFAVDAYTTTRKVHKIWKYVDIAPFIKQHATKYDKDKFPLPPLFVINFMVPDYEPALMGGKSDGEGLSIIVYAHISPETRKALELYAEDPVAHPMRPSIDLLQQFIHSDLVHSELRNRFKCIARVMNPKHTDFGFLANRMLNRYNGKPFLARTSSTFYHEPGQYFGADIDIHVFGYPARQGLSYVKGTLQTAIYDVGFTIEGHHNEQLPEQILACCRVSKIGFDVCEAFPALFMQRFIEEKEAEERAAERERVRMEEEAMNGDDGGGQHKEDGMARSGSTGNLLNGAKRENGRTMPPHSQSARNALKPTTAATKGAEAENKNKGDKAIGGSWGSVFRWGQ